MGYFADGNCRQEDLEVVRGIFWDWAMQSLRVGGDWGPGLRGLEFRTLNCGYFGQNRGWLEGRDGGSGQLQPNNGESNGKENGE